MTASDLLFGVIGLLGLLFTVLMWIYLIRGMILSYKIGKQKKLNRKWNEVKQQEKIFTIGGESD